MSGVTNSKSVQECSICYKDLDNPKKIQALNCMHIFHRSCIGEWEKMGHNDCPLCKMPFNAVLIQPPQQAHELQPDIVIDIDQSSRFVNYGTEVHIASNPRMDSPLLPINHGADEGDRLLRSYNRTSESWCCNCPCVCAIIVIAIILIVVGGGITITKTE